MTTPTYTIRYTIGDKTLTLTERGRRDAKRRVSRCLKMIATIVGLSQFVALHIKDGHGNVVGRWVAEGDGKPGRWL